MQIMLFIVVSYTTKTVSNRRYLRKSCRLLRLALEEWDNSYDDSHNTHKPYIRYIRATSREVGEQYLY